MMKSWRRTSPSLTRSNPARSWSAIEMVAASSAACWMSADLMFAQHMLAVCKSNGIVTTVMPNGVLFRCGEEKKIRKKFLEQDLIEAIIGLPPNLFYGAAIPACILVMRPNLSGHISNPNKTEPRRRRVLFINADAEFYPGRAQNYLLPEHVEKIVSTYDRFEDVP